MSRKSGNSFSSDVIKRLLQALIENSRLGKTRLGGKAGINYEMCIKYVNFLAMLNWVEIIKVEGTERVSITSEGIEHLRKLQGERSRQELDAKGDTNISVQNLNKGRDGGGGSSSTQRKTLYQHHIPKGKQKNIVIVDDDESSLIMYEAFLEDYSSRFKVKTFSHPDQALRYLIDYPNSYDLVVLDIRMPKMSGIRFFQGLKAANPRAKVLFLSSLDAAPELPDIFPNLKPNDFIRKPVERNEFIRIISAAVSS